MQQKTVLVVGGAGYIGSYVNKMLHAFNFKTVVFDNLCRGTKNSVVRGDFFLGDTSQQQDLDAVFDQYSIDAVMHFAAHIAVGESVTDPKTYYQNNVCNSLKLLQTMLRHNVKTLIFSSTAAIFGLPLKTPIDEDHPLLPINPYGHSKLMVEQILSDFARAYDLRYCSLRYFNAAGGDPEGEIKHPARKESNLIPLAISNLVNNTPLTLFGSDYETYDGSCIRDYIHIHDLSLAHILSLKKLLDGMPSSTYNLGNGKGFSVLEVIESINRITKKQVQVLKGPRRPGDPPFLIASSQKAKLDLGWVPQYPDLDSMVLHAWNAMQPQFISAVST